jgi:hypothetical protein
MTTTSQNSHTTQQCIGFNNKIPFESISDPGCYICNWSGHLLRVPEDGVTPGRSPLVNIIGTEPLYVTKIADNPFIPVTKARMIACNLDINVNF